MEFEWDLGKEVANLKKHKISFVEAAETFSDPNGVRLIDSAHSEKEERLYWIGKSKSDRILTTWYTHRENITRIIGCAEWRKFRKIYETAKID